MKATKEQRAVLLKAASPEGVDAAKVRTAFNDGSGISNNLFRYEWRHSEEKGIVGTARLSSVGEFSCALLKDQLALAKRLKEKKE